MPSMNVFSLLRSCALASLFVMATANVAGATSVTFSTTGDFAGAPNNAVTFGSGGNTATFTFIGVTTGPVDTPASSVSLGTLGLSILGLGYIDGTGQSTGFTLTVNQSAPSADQMSFSGTLTGSVARLSPNQSNFALTFSNSTIQIGDVTYTLDQLLFGIPAPASACGGAVTCSITTIRATITAPPTAVPEPATWMLLGSGLIVGFRALLRR